MHQPLSVSSHRQERIVRSHGELRDLIWSVDTRGGGEHWLARLSQEFPCLAIRTSSGLADVHYFPRKGHPGFRLLADCSAQSDAVFQFEGCDPYDGEGVPAEFVVSLVEALVVAEHFMLQGGAREQSKWFEL